MAQTRSKLQEPQGRNYQAGVKAKRRLRIHLPAKRDRGYNYLATGRDGCRYW
jgi:hypothetical protein